MGISDYIFVIFMRIDNLLALDLTDKDGRYSQLARLLLLRVTLSPYFLMLLFINVAIHKTYKLFLR